MAYQPITGKLKVNLQGSSFNVNQFKEQYEDRERAVYQDADINNLSFGAEFKEKDTPLSFDVLRKIAKEVAPISAIINTRKDQVASFAKQARYAEDAKGFQIKLRDRDVEPTDKELEEILQIEEFIINCGHGKKFNRDDFGTFLRKGVKDTLVLDQMPFEIIRDEDGKPYEFHIVDGATIRVAREDYKPDKTVISNRQFVTHETTEDVEHIAEDLEDVEEDEIEFVQVIRGQIVAWFSSKELAFPIRNPSTDLTVIPYGESEIEVIVRQLTSYLEAEDYNMRFFKQGGMTKGILNIKEDPNGLANRQGLESFKRQWRSQVTGQQGAWKIPVFQLPGELEFINIQQSGGEMVFEKWQNYLINIISAVYKIDPAEINFPNNGGVGGKGNSLFEGGSSKVGASKDKGLVPLLQFFEDAINKYLIQDFNDKYVFVFTGFDEESEAETLDKDNKKVSTYMTVNELRKEKGMQELENGDIILNPYFMQAQMNGGGGGFEFTDDNDDDEFNFENDDDDETYDDEEIEGEQADFDPTDEIEEDVEKAVLSIEIFKDR